MSEDGRLQAVVGGGGGQVVRGRDERRRRRRVACAAGPYGAPLAARRTAAPVRGGGGGGGGCSRIARRRRPRWTEGLDAVAAGSGPIGRSPSGPGGAWCPTNDAASHGRAHRVRVRRHGARTGSRGSHRLGTGLPVVCVVPRTVLPIYHATTTTTTAAKGTDDDDPCGAYAVRRIPIRQRARAAVLRMPIPSALHPGKRPLVITITITPPPHRPVSRTL